MEPSEAARRPVAGFGTVAEVGAMFQAELEDAGRQHTMAIILFMLPARP